MSDTSSSLPKGIWNAYWFQVFNTVSWSLVLSAPMMLYFKQLGASATVLGIVVALPPLTALLQIPAADYVERIGYRRFVLRGWSVRTALIAAIAVVPLAPRQVAPATRMILMLFLLFVFNASRGISLCGWLPWIMQLIPEAVRGRYFSREQVCSSLAMLGAMLLAAGLLGPTSPGWAYAAVFAVSFLGGAASLWYLSRIPDVPPADDRPPPGSRPWGAMLRHPPFARVLIFDAVVLTAFAGSGVLWIPLARDLYGVPDRFVLFMTALWAVMTAVGSPVVGRTLDRVGSRPVLALALLVLVVHFGTWAALGARAIPLDWRSVLLVQGTAAMGVILFTLSNTRLVMSTVPGMGRSHFLALFSVTNSLFLGLLPVFWGMAADGFGDWSAAWGRWEWNKFSVLYVVLAAVTASAEIARRRLIEPKAMATDDFLQELFVRTPTRALSRLLGR